MRKKKNALGYTYLAPALISILLVTCLPIIYTVILSFTNYNMYHLTDYTFVGLENYLTVFSGSIKNVFFPVLGWTICFALLSTAGSYAMGLILAILLNNPHMKESKIYRAVLIVPWALPSTIAILAWQGLLNEQYGGINNLLHTIGIAWNVPWLTNPFWARVGLIIVTVLPEFICFSLQVIHQWHLQDFRFQVWSAVHLHQATPLFFSFPHLQERRK